MLAFGVFLVVLAVYSLTFSGLPDNPDAEVEFQTTSALARTGELALGGTPEADAIVAQRFDCMEGVGDREGKFYSWFGVGQAFVGVPFYFAGDLLERAFPEVEERHRQTTAHGVGRSEYFQHLLVGWRNPLFGALTIWVFVFVARRLGASRTASCVAALSLAFATYLWPQSRSTLSDVQATFFLFFSFHLILRFREKYLRMRTVKKLELVLFGLSLGMAFLTRVLTAPAIAVLVLTFVFVCARGRIREGNGAMAFRELVIGLVPAVFCAALFLWTNFERFGEPLETGYGDAVGPSFFRAYPVHLGLVAQLASPGRGLLWLAPGALLGFLGLVRAWGRGERLWPTVFCCLFVAIAVPPAATLSWGGAWTFGPRYALPLLPLIWVGVAPVWDAATSAKSRLIPLGLLAVGVIPNLGAVFVDHMTHQELAMAAARIEWPQIEGVDDPLGAQAENERFERIKWDWRFAAPWAHWRILRHRTALHDEVFGVRELFFLDSDATVSPTLERSRGWFHLAWYDLEHRLGGAAWPALLLIGLMGLVGTVELARSFDATLA